MVCCNHLSSDSFWFLCNVFAYRYVIECCHCGVIYRSRQHWYGNEEPELEAVKTDNKHVWPQVYTSIVIELPNLNKGAGLS